MASNDDKKGEVLKWFLKCRYFALEVFLDGVGRVRKTGEVKVGGKYSRLMDTETRF